MKRLLLYTKLYRLTLLSSAVILYLCFIPNNELPEADLPLADKWTHVVLFFTLCLIMWAEYWRCHTRKQRAQRHIWIGVVAPIALGLIIEVGQSMLTATRSGDVWDWLADTLGVLIAAWVGVRFLRRYAYKGIE